MCSPEKMHTPPKAGIGNSREEGEGSQRLKNVNQCWKLNWNF